MDSTGHNSHMGLDLFYPGRSTTAQYPLAMHQKRRSSSCQPKPSTKEHLKGVPSPKPVIDADGKIVYRRERRAFTADEDVRLVKGFEKHGPSWTKIQRDPELDFGTRRSTDLRDRFRNAFPAEYAAAGFKARPPKTNNKRSRTTSHGSLSSVPSPIQQPSISVPEQTVHWAPISYQSSSSNASSSDMSCLAPTVKDRRAVSQGARSLSLDSGFYSGTGGSTTQLETWPEYYGSYMMPAQTQIPQMQSSLPPIGNMTGNGLPLFNGYASAFFEQPQMTSTVMPDDDGMNQFWQAGAIPTQYPPGDYNTIRYTGVHPDML